MTTLNTLFGSEICVNPTPHNPQRQFSGFAGADGLTAMYMGTRGYTVEIAGKLRAAGATYASARAALITVVATVEGYQALGALNYSYGSEAYYFAIFEGFKVTGGKKKYHYNTQTAKAWCEFSITLRCLI